MINLDFDTLDIHKFQEKMRQYPKIIGVQFVDLIKKLTQLGERNIANAVRSGDTRAFDTGNLFNNIKSKFDNIANLQGEIISDAPYSLYIHSGTRYMRARPYMTRGLDNSVNDFNRLIDNFLEKVFKM